MIIKTTIDNNYYEFEKEKKCMYCNSDKIQLNYKQDIGKIEINLYCFDCCKFENFATIEIEEKE